MSLAVLILAAGKGTRLKSQKPKVLHAIGGKPLLEHVISAATKVVPAEDIFVIVGHQAERVQSTIAPLGVWFVLQTEQRGTGDAVKAARDVIAGYDNVLVLSGDVPLIRTSTIERIASEHAKQHAAMTILTAKPENPFGYGRIVRKSADSVEVAAIVEQKSLAPEQLGIGEINSGIYAFQTAALLSHLDQLGTANAHGEYYLTDMASLLVAAQQRVIAVEAEEAAEVLGANTIAELVSLDATLRRETANRLMAEGVTIFRPETSIIDADVEVGPDTILEPFVQLLGRTKIGSGCQIRSYSVIENATLAEDVLVRQSCIITESTVGAGAKLGPFAHLRPESEIGPEAHIGNFVETKKAKLGKGAKANHLAYIGDASVGEKTNVGAGVITCNYDGVNKHFTQIGKNAFIGSDSTLVAPLVVGDGAYVGAGSCITKDVPENSLAVGRARQVVKEGWVEQKRRARQEQQK